MEDNKRALLRRIIGEYHDMPGVTLTAVQARRLHGLSADVCDGLYRELVNSGELCLRPDGRYSLPD